MSESITDIVRALRDGSVYNEGGCIYLHEIADRIEAAHEREVVVSKNATTTKESLAVGNNAKIREVLVELAKDFREHEESASLRSPAYSSMFGCFAERIEKALAEPPRNCDKFDDDDDAFAAWHDSLVDGDVVSVRNGFRWLLAEAKEGGVE